MLLKTFHNKLNRKEEEKLSEFLKIGKREIVGEGTFATVFSLSKDKVVRLEPVGETIRLSGYHKYVSKFVLKHQSKYLPKIYFHGVCKLGFYLQDDYSDREYIITVIEKLSPNIDFSNTLDHAITRDQERLDNEKYDKILPSRKLSNFKRLYNKMIDVGLNPQDAGWENILFRKDKKSKSLIPVYTDPCYN